MTPAEKIVERRTKLAKANRACAYCGAQLKGVIYFCAAHWWQLPPVERSALYAMHHKGTDPSTKVAKCVRLLQKKLSRGKAVDPAGPSAEPAGLVSSTSAESHHAENCEKAGSPGPT